ncbi:MAG: YkgJ family cysteine cluster protein [Bacillota bacterium]
MPAAVLALQVELQGVQGFDVKIIEAGATAEDYLTALNNLIEGGSLYRARNNVNSCYGCDLCCRERAPLTLIDVQALAPGADSVQEALAGFARIVVSGPVVDIVLGRTSQGKCVFLNPRTRLCTVYEHRPLVCRTFICSPATKRATLLRELIVNKGEDELVRRWLAEQEGQGKSPGGATRPGIEDYPPSAFIGKNSYGEVLLRDLCSPSLWRRLIKE